MFGSVETCAHTVQGTPLPPSTPSLLDTAHVHIRGMHPKPRERRRKRHILTSFASTESPSRRPDDCPSPLPRLPGGAADLVPVRRMSGLSTRKRRNCSAVTSAGWSPCTVICFFRNGIGSKHSNVFPHTFVLRNKPVDLTHHIQDCTTQDHQTLHQLVPSARARAHRIEGRKGTFTRPTSLASSYVSGNRRDRKIVMRSVGT